MQMAGNVNAVIQDFARMVAPDGGRLELLGVEGTVVRVRYERGSAACETCVLTAEDLGELLLEAVQRRDASLTKVLMC